MIITEIMISATITVFDDAGVFIISQKMVAVGIRIITFQLILYEKSGAFALSAYKLAYTVSEKRLSLGKLENFSSSFRIRHDLLRGKKQ